MPKLAPISHTIFLVLIATLLQICIAKDFNIVDFGAKADGKTDSSSAFYKAWVAACNSDEESTIFVPGGTFMVNSVSFNGTCKKYMKIQISGNLIAPDNYQELSNHQAWISFYSVSGLSINGGTIDAKGSSYWECKRGGKDCPYGARSFSLQSCTDVLVNGLKSFNSEGVHISINGCKNITMYHLTLTAPVDSPNTDGIHIGNSEHVKVLYRTIGTGDDCISIGPGSRNMWMDHIACGPGHGISSGVKISDVKFNNIWGTSRSLEALVLDCSSTNPCERITLQDINLSYVDNMKKTQPSKSRCQNARVIKAGVGNPTC